MKITHRSNSSLSDIEQKTLAHGAEEAATDGNQSAGLWFSHTPEYNGKRVGAIGACSLDDSDAASAFLSQCAEHLHTKHGCQHVIGPMNGNTWLTHRLILESNHRAPFQMESMEPWHYHDIFLNAGFEILSKYSSSSIDLTQEQRSFEKMESKLIEKGVQFRPIDPDNYEQDLEAIHALSLISFSNNFLYTPLPREVFMQNYLKTKDHIDTDMVILAEWQGALAGFVFCMPDKTAEMLDLPKTVIVKTLAVDPNAPLAGLGSMLVAKAHTIATEKGYCEAIHALQHENNSSLRISQRFGAEIFRRYALMVKSFS
ncbi:MAG: GNAT family N-acetyltransferase [Akkermansiaceae bacterium]